MYTFTKATKMGFTRALDFKGKSTRSEYWWFVFAIFLIELVVITIGAVFAPLLILAIPLFLWILLASMSIVFRRVRDAGGSAWIPGGVYIASALHGASIGLAVGVPNAGLAAVMVFGGISLVLSLVTLVFMFLPSKRAKEEFEA
jgi:uncharacterized membrane protein YhaH (DUF805 family)